MSRPRLIALLLALGTLVVFLPAGRFGFVDYDDPGYVTKNNFVKNGLDWTDMRWAFSTFYASNWHPLTWLSHMTDISLFGLNPGAMHFVNVLFHAVNTALLFILLLRLTQKTWPSAFVAALFAWHPLHVESVAWISERKDVLSTFFALLSLFSYAEFAMKNRRRDWWLALLFFALGLLAKPMVVTLPFVMLLLDFWPLNRVASSRLKVEVPMFRNLQPSTFGLRLIEKIPFFLLSVAASIVTCLAQRGAMATLEKVALPLRLENSLVAYAGYLLKIFWPANLCVLYPMPKEIPGLQIFFALAALLLISVIAWRWRRTRPYFLMGWLWFLGTLVPVIGLVQVGVQAMADRYAYIPSIGFFIALVFLANECAERVQTPKIIRFGLGGLVCCACILVTENQLSFWRDSETLFRRAAVVTQNNDIALLDLGVALDAQGRFEEAIDIYRRAEKSGSRRVEVHNNLGNILGIMGRHAESLAEYREAIRLDPNDASLHYAAGRQLAALGRFDEALNEFESAEKLDPNFAAPHVDAAKVLFKMGRDAEGLDEFSAALRIEPGNYQTLATVAHYLSANENPAARDVKDALVLALKANELSGKVQPMVLDILGMAFAANGDFTNAVACARDAVKLAQAAQMENIGLLQSRLELYQNNQPWRESFRATNAPPKD